MFDQFFQASDVNTLKCINQTFITLIPKKSHAEKVQDFRSISLLNSSYKIISKCLASRLCPILNDLLDESQCAFLPGKSISDYFLVAQETLHFMNSSHSPGLLLKLDFEKAFDNVNWEFLLNSLAGLGCDNIWVNWIKMCISLARFTVLVNGSPRGFFGASNGLRQGDPLSPLLFIVAAHVLHRMLALGVYNNLITGIQFPNGGPQVLNI